MSSHTPSDTELRELLKSSKTISVVGCSPDPDRPSHRIASHLQSYGYRVIPVHPAGGTILGERVYPTLEAIPAAEQIDIVDVFRRPEHAPEVARQAVQRRARALWLQLGVVSEEACRIATAAGLLCVMNRCIHVSHRELIAF